MALISDWLVEILPVGSWCWVIFLVLFLWLACTWKNLVFLSPSRSQCCLARYFHLRLSSSIFWRKFCNCWTSTTCSLWPPVWSSSNWLYLFYCSVVSCLLILYLQSKRAFWHCFNLWEIELCCWAYHALFMTIAQSTFKSHEASYRKMKGLVPIDPIFPKMDIISGE